MKTEGKEGYRFRSQPRRLGAEPCAALRPHIATQWHFAAWRTPFLDALIEQFRYRADPAALEDIRARLERTIFPDEVAAELRRYGPPVDYMSASTVNRANIGYVHCVAPDRYDAKEMAAIGSAETIVEANNKPVRFLPSQLLEGG